MIEVFQNIVRHSDQKYNNDFFSVRSLQDGVHIFSSNKIDAKSYLFLKENLSKINSLNSDELNTLYREILYNGQMSNKGGAGLGLIQMARKSKNNIQHQFNKINTDSYLFSYQLDISTSKKIKLDKYNTIDINANLEVFSKFIDDNIMLFYKGNFSKENINSLLSLLKANTPQESENKQLNNYKIFHTGVELIQNVSRHGKKKGDFLEGVFCIFKTNNGYYLCTGNLLKSGDFSEVENHFNRINNLPITELKSEYLKTLKENSLNEDNKAGVGLIDVRRYNKTKLDFEIQNSDQGLYLSLGVNIPINN